VVRRTGDEAVVVDLLMDGTRSVRIQILDVIGGSPLSFLKAHL
jgi:hypothetical protein